ADGILVALGSSAKADELGAYKRIANIGDLLDAETSSHDAAESKPDPDIFQAALHRLGKKPSQVVVVGDTPYDAEAAAKAGLRSIGLLCGGWSEDDLRQAGAWRSIAIRRTFLPATRNRRWPRGALGGLASTVRCASPRITRGRPLAAADFTRSIPPEQGKPAGGSAGFCASVTG